MEKQNNSGNKSFISREDQIIFDHKIACVHLLEDVSRFLKTFDKDRALEYIDALISALQ